MTEHAAALAGLDAESAEWPQALADTGPRREEALARLHGLLVRTARKEVARCGPRLQLTGPELDDLACPAVRLLARGWGDPAALWCVRREDLRPGPLRTPTGITETAGRPLAAGQVGGPAAGKDSP
jgi:hypothetical protein